MDLDPVDASGAAERVLRGAYIHDEEMVATVEDAADAILGGAISDDEAHAVALAPAERGTGPDRLRVAEIFPRLTAVGPAGLCRPPVPRDEVESDERHGCPAGLDGGVGFDARFQAQRVRERREVAEQTLVDSAGSDDLERGLAGKRLH